VDIALLSESHMYRGFGIPFEPEGLLSSIPAVGTVIIGFLVGQLIDRGSSMLKAVQYLAGFGISAILIALLWDGAFPINKPLWTSSYVLYTAGIASLILGLFYWLIEYKGWKKWASPLVVFGVNPLFIYALSIILVKILIHLVRWQQDGETVTGYGWLYQHIFVPIAGNLNGSLLFGLTYVAVHWLVAWVLFKRKIFIKV
jgi:predicted acyltransferase